MILNKGNSMKEKSKTQMSKYTKRFKINMLLGVAPFTINVDDEYVNYDILLFKFESLAFKFGLKITRNGDIETANKRIAYGKRGFGTIKLIKNVFTWIPNKIERKLDIDEDISEYGLNDIEQEVLDIIKNN